MAKQRDKSPNATTRLSPKIQTQNSGTSQYIEDVSTQDLKLFFKGFKDIYTEFEVLQEITTHTLEGMGIFFKVMRKNKPFMVVDASPEQMEQEVQMDEGIFQSTDHMISLEMSISLDRTPILETSAERGERSAEKAFFNALSPTMLSAG